MKGLRTDKPPSQADIEKSLDTLLEYPIWPRSLQTKTTHVRRHDDTDGQTGPEQDLMVYLSQDTDAFVIINGVGLRFRGMFGGGMSPRTRNALLVLAEAIRRDNETIPQHEDQP